MPQTPTFFALVLAVIMLCSTTDLLLPCQTTEFIGSLYGSAAHRSCQPNSVFSCYYLHNAPSLIGLPLCHKKTPELRYQYCNRLVASTHSSRNKQGETFNDGEHLGDVHIVGQHARHPIEHDSGRGFARRGFPGEPGQPHRRHQHGGISSST
uniref:Secreted protein n=1 Tax=Hordeum vulgare subsp. vulgare TaxID=112509 RepID=A0A8I6Y6Q8_HORVV